jgi:hypothetical protein
VWLRGGTRHLGARALGIGILILSVIHIPLPQADYHNIRHHDAPGESCPYHEHLVRWHPSADRADDVSLLHWHWFVPQVAPGDPQHPDGEPRSPVSGPSLHAQVGDWPEPDWTGEPVIRPDGRGRLLEHLALGLSGACTSDLSGSVPTPSSAPGSGSASPPGGAGALRAAPIVRFPRWNC